MIAVQILPEAEHDVEKAGRWYEFECQRPDLVEPFTLAYRNAVLRALQMPEAPRPEPGVTGPMVVRRSYLQGFPYFVAYGGVHGDELD